MGWGGGGGRVRVGGRGGGGGERRGGVRDDVEVGVMCGVGMQVDG